MSVFEARGTKCIKPASESIYMRLVTHQQSGPLEREVCATQHATQRTSRDATLSAQQPTWPHRVNLVPLALSKVNEKKQSLSEAT